MLRWHLRLPALGLGMLTLVTSVSCAPTLASRTQTGSPDAAAAKDYRAGQRVRCRWLAGATWYPAQVTGLDGGRVLVDYEDGEREAIAPSLCQLADGSQPQDAAGPKALQQGDRVSCYWGGGAVRYPGVVSAVNKGALTIKYDDGESETLARFRCVAAAAGDTAVVAVSDPAQGSAQSAPEPSVIPGSLSETHSPRSEQRLNAMKTFAKYVAWLSHVPGMLSELQQHYQKGDAAAWERSNRWFAHAAIGGRELWANALDDFKLVQQMACRGAGPWLQKLQTNLLIVHEAHAVFEKEGPMGELYLEDVHAAHQRAEHAAEAITRAYKFLIKTCP